MNKIILYFIIAFFGFPIISLAQTNVKPQDLGLSVIQGQISESRMSHRQKDTIVTGLFNFEDYFLDIAVAYNSKLSLTIFRNNGNGSLSEFKSYNTKDRISKIEIIKPDSLQGASGRAGLKIVYNDGTIQQLSSSEINGFDKNDFTPLRNIFTDSKIFVYDITFVEQWRSQRNGQPHNWVAVGDIDKDGRNEAVYTFYPINDTFPQFSPATIVVFENVSQNQYRIDWDTTLYYAGAYNIFPDITDFDKDGNLEFFARGKDFLGNIQLGLYECSGEGKYKFRFASLGGFASPFDIEVKDSVTVNGITKPELWLCEASSTTSYFSRYRFNTKGSLAYSFWNVAPGPPRVNWFVYSISADDIDKDGKDEVILGDTQFGTNYIDYLDTTGTGSFGYEVKEIIPNAPLSAGWSFHKDYDGDGFKEITTCGIGDGSGSIGILKHTGVPGENQFTTVWWDSSNIVASPNMGIDTGSIDNHYSVLYPCVKFEGPLDFLNLITFSRNGIYNFDKSGFQVIDSAALLNPLLFEIDSDYKMNIISSGGFNGPPFKFGIIDLEQNNVMNVDPNSNELLKSFILEQNYPNPFNSSTVIAYNIKTKSHVILKIYDVTGKEVKVLTNKNQNIGSYFEVFEGNDFSTGIYFYSLYTDKNLVDTKKMLLIK